ncbi:GNAT family N-acetyltransferase [Massilia sp. G4R7]|uniref:GNAT family N-acetyltransferase n=1 Tax=Massilia phyllostachyos TaxID=2898585 RepID=A0ABS8Q571_9BURK|nr:GNAT family N-acetyltransferase [Massilia phyllostachyos]MCD2516889.1 GNAT family N-acetyltransferase [Massilia phyllostachyos]
MRIATRLAQPADKAAIWEIYQAALKPHIQAIWGWDEAWQLAHFDDAYALAVTCVVAHQQEMSGYIQLDIGDTEVYLRMLVLAPDARSKGIGAALLSEIRRRVQQSGRQLGLRVFRVNEAAKRFYERERWQVQSEDEAFFTMAYPQDRSTQTKGSPRHLSPQDIEFVLEL